MINIIQNTIGALARKLGIVKKNLQLWLDFEKSEWVGGELVVKDKSPNTNNAKLFTGKAMSFDGVNDYVDCGNSSDITSPNKLSFLGWVINEDVTQNDTVFIGNIVAGGWQIGVKSNGSIYFRVRADNDVTIVSSTNFGDATPHRVVATYDRTTMKLYVDGSLEATSSNTGDIDTPTQNTYIGADAQGASGQGDFFNGVLSDFQVWNEDVEQSDITFDYNNPNHLVTDNPNSTIALSNLKGYWALSEGDGGIAYDSSGGGNDGTSYDGNANDHDGDGTIFGATYVDKQPTIPQLGMMDWAKSTPVADEITLIQDPNNKGFDILGNPLRLREHGFNLDGSGYGEVADDDSLDITTEITLAAWVEWNTENDKGIVGRWDNSKQDFMLHKRTNGFAMYIGLTNLVSSPITGSDWVYVVGTYDGANIKTYINGVLDNTMAKTGLIPTNDRVIEIGRYGGATNNDSYSDAIDEVMIYDRALTLKEVKQNYKIGLKEHKVGSAFSDDFSSDFGF